LNDLGGGYLYQTLPIDEPFNGTKPTIPGFTKHIGTTLLLFEIAATKIVKDNVRKIPIKRPLTNGLIIFITFTLLIIIPESTYQPSNKKTHVGIVN
jgi:hypothetical protein